MTKPNYSMSNKEFNINFGCAGIILAIAIAYLLVRMADYYFA